MLDPLERVSEILFGLIMALSITGTIDVAAAKADAGASVLAAALGCNLAWGCVDGVLYLVSQLVERGRQLHALRAFATARDEATVRGMLADAVPKALVQLLDIHDLE